ncbi:SUN domain-containing protein 1 [Selaginella moellendorffii]|nr:SUN domain-containing protein 1 [Selaginella moellendorffii]|eukprot:XP_002991956.2 SUN domain-containing protein 1 [Selaginella moellendorffii]
MLAAAVNSTSTATSGSIPPPPPPAAPAVPSRARKRPPTSRSHSMVAAAPEEQGIDNGGAAAVAGAANPASNTANGGCETCCSVGNGEGEAVSSPLRKTSLRAPKTGNKVARSSHKQDSSSRPGAETHHHLAGPLFSKPVFIAVMLAVMATTAWKWSRDPGVAPGISIAQMKELEDFSRKTTKWMQVQLELVDMKIGKEIEGLRRDVEDKIEEQALALETSIMNLKSQVEDMDSSVQRLTQDGLLTKKEGMELIASIIQQRAAEESGKSLTLDDVRIAARQIVEAELEKHSADGIGRVDYALGSGGGKIIEHSEGFFTGGRAGWLSILGAGLSAGGAVRHPMAHKVLEPSYGEPGQCLPLKGSNVFVEIALRTHIHPDAITIEHVPKSVAYDVTSAPKDFRVFGWLERSIQAGTIARPVKKLLLGEFSYSLDGSNIQTFSFPEEVSRELINTVRIHITSNHGSSSHTCLYRVRVHGFEPSPQHF